MGVMALVWLPVPERVGLKVLPILNKSLSSIRKVRKRWVSNRNPRTFRSGRFQVVDTRH